MFFSDIHTHILSGCDDGAKTQKDMLDMVRVAYEGGTRLICLTPHFFPAFFGDNKASSEESFEVLSEYCAEHYPDLTLVLGNELAYKHDSISWMNSELCRTMGNTNYVLVEFSIRNSEDMIAEGIYRLQNSGYSPIIAHAERYTQLSKGRIWSFRQNGVMIQMNADAIVGRRGFFEKRRIRALLKAGYVDFVSSDAHDASARSPKLRKAYEYVSEKYGTDYANKIFCENAVKLFGIKKESEEINNEQ